MNEISKSLTFTEFYMREHALEHSPIEAEMQFYNYIKAGDMEGVKRTLTPLGGEGFGILSKDKLQNLKYHLVISIAFITRFCVEGGMERETAYNLSDLYIQKTDTAKSIKEIDILHLKMIEDFTKRMSTIKRTNPYSKPVVQCMEYIYNHLNSKITLSNIAHEIGLSDAYLSRLFHQETGKTITEYILSKRIEAACNMLIYSEYSASDIAEFLAFSSHSHFIDTFRKRTGFTPKEYRNKYFHTTGSIKGSKKTDIKDKVLIDSML